MKTQLVFYFFLLISLTFGCRNGNNSWRYLVRSANKARQIEANEKQPNFSSKYQAEIFGFEKLPDTLGIDFFNTNVLLKGDTANYITFTQMGLPYELGLKEPITLVLRANYYWKDTTNYISSTLLLYNDFPKNAKISKLD